MAAAQRTGGGDRCACAALHITALGGSPGGTVEGEVVRFDNLAALQAAPAGSLAGKIAFVDYQMTKARDGKDYGNGGAVRSKGPSEAIRKGAIGFVMRSAGTDSHRVPHTGITRFDEGVTPVPAAALSVPDANQLARLTALGSTRVRLALDCGWDGTATSYNVIGEITGRSKPKEVVVIGGHLDSWDLGTGAIDDGAGVAITMAAGHLIGQLKQTPKRSIRVVAFANEEQGLYGGKAYAAAHGKDAKDMALHQIGAESDFGAGRIYAFNTGSAAPDASRAATRQIAEVLAPLGIAYEPSKGGPADVRPISAKGGAWAWLAQDGTDYFDLHHTADDTLDKIDPKALAQNVAAYTVFAYLAAEADGDFGSRAKACSRRANNCICRRRGRTSVECARHRARARCALSVPIPTSQRRSPAARHVLVAAGFKHATCLSLPLQDEHTQWRPSANAVRTTRQPCWMWPSTPASRR